MKILLCALTLILFTACNSSDKKQKPPPKPLFSAWEHLETNSPLDLSNASFDDSLAMVFKISSEAACSCDITLDGDNDAGSFELNNCVLHEGDEDPGCNALNQTGSYINANNWLTLTSNAGHKLLYR
ncbi:MAG: hypothetical protein KAG18_04700 [Sinobacterium sp.]|nr:hypothetical protein [Sinobacterium sp.]